MYIHLGDSLNQKLLEVKLAEFVPIEEKRSNFKLIKEANKRYSLIGKQF